MEEHQSPSEDMDGLGSEWGWVRGEVGGGGGVWDTEEEKAKQLFFKWKALMPTILLFMCVFERLEMEVFESILICITDWRLKPIKEGLNLGSIRH